jgi:hypothetical protein
VQEACIGLQGCVGFGLNPRPSKGCVSPCAGSLHRSAGVCRVWGLTLNLKMEVFHLVQEACIGLQGCVGYGLLGLTLNLKRDVLIVRRKLA